MDAEIVASETVKAPPLEEMWLLMGFRPSDNHWMLIGGPVGHRDTCELWSKTALESYAVIATRIIRIPGDTPPPTEGAK